jgi:hypothetical protein
MNATLIRSFLATGVLGIGTALLPAQDQKPGTESPAPKAEVEADPTTSELIEQLGDRSFQVRKSAEASLRQRGADALAELRKAAADGADAEVQWRARRLVREIESGNDGRLQRRGDRAGRGNAGAIPPGTWAPWQGWRQLHGQGDLDLEQVFGDLFERLERDFGVDVPRGRFFHDDFFQSLQQQMEEARRGNAMGLPGTGQAFSMQMDQNGVRIEITEKGEDGKSESKVYEAPDLQTFRQKYPEIAERYLREDGARMFGFGGQAPGLRTFRFTPMAPNLDLTTPPMDDGFDNGDRLGVMVEVPSADLREFLQLDPNQGLRVVGVQDDSMAAAAGVEVGDVVLEVGGTEVGSAADVRAALAKVEAGSKLTIKVNRRGKEHALETEKVEASAPASSGKLEKRDGGRRIR